MIGESYADVFALAKDLMKSAKPSIAGLEVLLNKLNNQVLSDQNIAAIEKLIGDTNGLIIGAQGTLARLDGKVNGTEATEGLIDRLIRFLDEIDDTKATLLAKIEELKSSSITTLESFTTTSDNASGAITEARAALRDDILPKLDSLMVMVKELRVKFEPRIETTFDKLDDVLDGGNELVRNKDLSGAVYDLRQALQEFRLLMISIRADPSQVLFGGPGIAETSDPKTKDESKQRSGGRAKRYGY